MDSVCLEGIDAGDAEKASTWYASFEARMHHQNAPLAQRIRSGESSNPLGFLNCATPSFAQKLGYLGVIGANVGPPGPT